MRVAVFTALFLFGIVGVFAQSDGSIPEELLRPQRGETPRYPIDTVIGTLGQGNTPKEAYEFAKRTAAALLAGNMNAPILSTINKVFLESYMALLETVNPRFFRLGSGREESDGSVSFLVRFVGREQGITGELFIRFEERPSKPPVENPDPVPADEAEIESEEESEIESEGDSVEQNEEVTQVPPQNVPAEKIWIFEDLILEEARSREVENAESRHRFDFPPYERLF